MRPRRPWLASAGRVLADRLDRLRRTLDALQDRLREAVGPRVRDFQLRVLLHRLQDRAPGLPGLSSIAPARKFLCAILAVHRAPVLARAENDRALPGIQDR